LYAWISSRRTPKFKLVTELQGFVFLPSDLSKFDRVVTQGRISMTFYTRSASLLLGLLLAASGAQAQHRWNGKNKHWYSDWLWWVGEGVMAAAFVADAHSTTLGLSSCSGCREANPLIGPHPSDRTIVVDSSIFFAALTGLQIASWKTCPDPNREYKSWHVACDMTVPTIAALFKVPAAVHNYNLAARSTSPSMQSRSVTKFGRFGPTKSIGGGTSSWGSYGNHTFFLPKQLSGCGHGLNPCSKARELTWKNVDLGSVQFR